MSIFRFSINDPVVIHLITIITFVVVTYADFTLPREVLLEIPFNCVFVTTIYSEGARE